MNRLVRRKKILPFQSAARMGVECCATERVRCLENEKGKEKENGKGEIKRNDTAANKNGAFHVKATILARWKSCQLGSGRVHIAGSPLATIFPSKPIYSWLNI